MVSRDMNSIETRAALVGCLALALVPLAAMEAIAAVRVCKAPVASGLAREPSEPAAKKRAIEDWTRRAKASGMSNPAWRTAANKMLKCAPIGTATFECVAYGAPCTVQQNPPRRAPRGKGPSIEV
jgi:hypothetical protein